MLVSGLFLLGIFILRNEVTEAIFAKFPSRSRGSYIKKGLYGVSERNNKQNKLYKRCQSQGQVQGHAQVYRHAKFECNSLNIVRDIVS